MDKMLWVLAFATAMMFATNALTEPKGKGRAACQSIKSVIICNDRQDCAWVVEQKGKGKGPTGKCVPLKATPR